jgi:GNAT superfamily N-acetyltransferase
MAMRDDSAMAIVFRTGRSDESPGRELMAELNDLFNAQYPGRAVKPGSVTTPDEMVPPGGAFLVGYEDERAIAIGGLRPLEADGICEIKRMYVVPGAQSRGAGRALLAALEDKARELGYARVRLDAGRAQTRSIALFAKTGYIEIPRYNDNHIAVYFGEKQL